MSAFTINITINAPAKDVWAVLSDFGGIHNYMSGIVDVRLLTSEGQDVGAVRHCDLEGKPGKNFMVERVTTWEPGKRLAFAIDRSNAPMAAATVTWDLVDQGAQTELRVNFEYEPKYGPMGWLMDKMMMRRMMRNNLSGGLSEIKEGIEAGHFPVKPAAATGTVSAASS